MASRRNKLADARLLQYIPRQHQTSEDTTVLFDVLLEGQATNALDSRSMRHSAIYAIVQADLQMNGLHRNMHQIKRKI